MINSLADGSDTGQLSELFTERNNVKSKNCFQGKVNLSPAGNKAHVANEPSLNIFESSLNQIKPQLFALFRLKLLTHMANLSLTTTSMSIGRKRNVINFVFEKAPLEINIIQELQKPQYTPPSPSKN